MLETEQLQVDFCQLMLAMEPTSQARRNFLKGSIVVAELTFTVYGRAQKLDVRTELLANFNSKEDVYRLSNTKFCKFWHIFQLFIKSCPK